MRQKKALGREWIPILLVLFWCLAVYMSGVMGSTQAAYSPTVSSNSQAGQQGPGSGDRNSSRATASHGVMTPAQSADLWQDGGCAQLFSVQDTGLPRLNATACHAIRSLMYIKPLSELASRIGGHAPP